MLNDGVDAVTGTFNRLADNATVNVSGQPFGIRYSGSSGNDVTLVRDGGSSSPGVLLKDSIFSNSPFRLCAAGSHMVFHRLQAPTNFIQWTSFGFATGGVGGTFTFADVNAFRYPSRFYRATN